MKRYLSGIFTAGKAGRSVAAFAVSAVVIAFGFQNCSPNGFSAFSREGSTSQKNYISIVESWPSAVNSLSSEANKYSKRSAQSTGAAAQPINFGFHMGGVTPAGTALIEESLFADQPRSSWFIAQWKKIHPLRPSTDLVTNTSDNYLFKVEKPQNSESKLNGFVNSDGKLIYELGAKQGYLTSIGGSNVFVSADVKDRSQSRLNREVVFSFGTKLLKKSATVRTNYQSDAAALLKGPVSGFYLGGFPVSYDDGNPQNAASLFIQFYLADTRINNISDAAGMKFRAYYPHQNYMEIVAGLPINDITGNASDLMLTPDSVGASLRNIRVSINKLLCLALKGDFQRSDGQSGTISFANAKNGLYLKNLSGWTVNAVYMGLETQAVFFDESKDADKYFYPSGNPLYGAHDVRQDIKDRMTNNELYKGDVELVTQISDLALKAEAEPFTQLNTCDDVDKYYASANASLDIVETTKCTAGSVTSDGCNQVANALVQHTCNSDGKSYGVCMISCNSGYHLVGSACISDSSSSASSNSGGSAKPACTFGAGINPAAKQVFEWRCDCGSSDPVSNKAGWVFTGGTCYQRIADSFCAGSQKVYYTCEQSTTPPGSGWVPQGGGCYHWASGVSCSASAPAVVDMKVCSPGAVTKDGCSPVVNGSAQRTCSSDGMSYGACSISCNSGFHLTGNSCVADASSITSSSSNTSSSGGTGGSTKPACTFGAAINTLAKQAFEWRCDCSSSDPISNKSGWNFTGGTCYQRVADSFCAGSQKVYYACNQPTTPQGSGWVPQGGGCYHWPSGASCN